jgi:hypothetical protein
MAQTKQKKEIIALVALLFVAALVWYGFFGKGRGGASNQITTYVPINAEDYGKPFKDLEVTRTTDYKATGRNIFVAGPIAPPPTAPALVKSNYRNSGPQPQPEAPPPVLGMKFFGLGTFPSNGPRRAFLQDGDDVKIVGEGDTIQNHLRITHIGNDRIEYEDINTGKKNSTNLEMPPSA